MATRLNKTMIADIIAKAIKATTIEKEIDEVKNELHTRVHAYVKANTPPKLLELAKQHPREWFNWVSYVYTRLTQDACRANPLWHFRGGDKHNNPDIHFDPLPYASGTGAAECPPSIYEDLGLKAEEIMARKAELQDNLRAYLLSRRTIESALKDMPELEPFVPKGTGNTGGALVAASNVAALLAKSGYPPSNT